MLFLLGQAAQRTWSAEAVHDTVRAVVRDPAFRQSLRRSWLDRAMMWLVEWFRKLVGLFGDLPSARTIALVLIGLLVVFIVVRAIVAAAARADDERGPRRQGRASMSENPWQEADALAAEGRFEEAAHQLYRGVILTLSHGERLRFDPSMTSGDVARELRRKGSPSLNAFRTFVRRFDRAVYGHEGCDQRAFDELKNLSIVSTPKHQAA